jgi:hypothetical protein
MSGGTVASIKAFAESGESANVDEWDLLTGEL